MGRKLIEKKITPSIDWDEIETVMLDMDGTLLDRYFDDYFWTSYVPQVYAREKGVDFEEARSYLMAKFKKRQGTLAWSDIDFWTEKLGLDIALMKERLNHLIQVHPYVPDFLEFCRQKGKEVQLVTNAHSKTLAIKMAKAEIDCYFDRIICAEEVGLAKEESGFWKRLAELTGFRREASLLADDNQDVLASAEGYGIRYLIFVAKASTVLPARYSGNYPAIYYFNELMID
ncbi:MAG: HAD family hydrolase [Thermodesulfobacteriota bacterium]